MHKTIWDLSLYLYANLKMTAAASLASSPFFLHIFCTCSTNNRFEEEVLWKAKRMSFTYQTSKPQGSGVLFLNPSELTPCKCSRCPINQHVTEPTSVGYIVPKAVPHPGRRLIVTLLLIHLWSALGGKMAAIVVVEIQSAVWLLWEILSPH